MRAIGERATGIKVRAGAVRSVVVAAIAAAAIGGPGAAMADTVTLVPVRDTSIFDIGDTSNGAGAFLFAGRTGGRGAGTVMRSLLRFDLASIPAGSTITSVTLTLRLEQAGNTLSEAHALHRMLAAWDEGTSLAEGGTGAPATAGDATWADRVFPGTAWTTPGGDFVATPSGTTNISNTTASPTFSAPGMVQDVQAWVNDPATNFGWVLRGNETRLQSARKFGSSEIGVTTSAPRLTVVFTPPVACAADFNGVGGLSVQDIFDFLTAWFAGEPAADFNDAGGVTVQDLFDYLSAYFTGC